MICPKCGHERNTSDDPSVPSYQCPSCGIVYEKYLAKFANDQANTVVKSIEILPSEQPPKKSRLVSLFFDSLLKDKHSAVKPEKRISAEDLLVAQIELSRFKTNHFVHFLLSMLTGVWFVIWFITATSNTLERNKINRRCGIQEESNPGALILLLFAAFSMTAYLAAKFYIP